jgi:phage regulator Rha-like protein
MKYISKDTKTFKVFTALYNGEKLTPAQITKISGAKNPSAEILRIKQNGYAIYAKQVVAGNGRKVTQYEMGKPSREIVALGYKAKSMGITL